MFTSWEKEGNFETINHNPDAMIKRIVKYKNKLSTSEIFQIKITTYKNDEIEVTIKQPDANTYQHLTQKLHEKGFPKYILDSEIYVFKNADLKLMSNLFLLIDSLEPSFEEIKNEISHSLSLDMSQWHPMPNWFKTSNIPFLSQSLRQTVFYKKNSSSINVIKELILSVYSDHYQICAKAFDNEAFQSLNAAFISDSESNPEIEVNPSIKVFKIYFTYTSREKLSNFLNLFSTVDDSLNEMKVQLMEDVETAHQGLQVVPAVLLQQLQAFNVALLMASLLDPFDISFNFEQPETPLKKVDMSAIENYEAKLKAINFPDDLIPENYLCNIAARLMSHAVTDPRTTGVFDRTSILMHLSQSPIHPMSRTLLTPEMLEPLPTLSAKIKLFVAIITTGIKNAEAIDEGALQIKVNELEKWLDNKIKAHGNTQFVDLSNALSRFLETQAIKPIELKREIRAFEERFISSYGFRRALNFARYDITLFNKSFAHQSNTESAIIHYEAPSSFFREVAPSFNAFNYNEVMFLGITFLMILNTLLYSLGLFSNSTDNNYSLTPNRT